MARRHVRRSSPPRWTKEGRQRLRREVVEVEVVEASEPTPVVVEVVEEKAAPRSAAKTSRRKRRSAASKKKG